MAASLSARPGHSFIQSLINRKTVWSYLGLQHLSSVVASKQRNVSVDERKQEIAIPRKKKRDSLTVLKALAATVKRDTQSPHYKYMDDPYLIPTSNLSKKSSALAKESGKKAAKYILEKYSQFFKENPSEPPVVAFMPSKQTYSFTEPSEAALLERIEKRRVKDAIEVYRKIKQGNLDLSTETCRKLLELLCVYNSQDPPVTLAPEEFYFRRDLGLEPKSTGKTWKDNGMAERVFDELKEKTSEDQQNLICGMARHLQTEKAFTLYDEMKEKQMPIDLMTFNALIQAATFHHDTYETKWNQVESLLRDMEQFGVRPDLATFNNVLYSLTRMSMYRQTPSLILQTLNEMKSVGLEPCLASWKHVLLAFYPKDQVDSNVLYEIVDYLEGKEFTMQQADDVDFFISAMKRCCYNLQDVELAYRIDILVNTGNNYVLLGDSRLENMYYAFFFSLVCSFETMDKIMEVYHRVTPHLWSPPISIMEELLKAIELQDGYQHLPIIWTDLLLFDFQRRPELLEKLLQLMAKMKQESNLQSQFCHLATELLKQWTDREEGSPCPLSTGGMIGHLIAIAENSDDHDLAWNFFEIYNGHRHFFSGTPTDHSVKVLISSCLQRADLEKALTVLTMMETLVMEALSEAAQLILKSDQVQLSPVLTDRLQSIIGVNKP